MVSHKSVKLVIATGDPIDFSKLAKKESMDNVERWIVSISHTVRMIDFHQQEYRMLHERHLNGTFLLFWKNTYSFLTALRTTNLFSNSYLRFASTAVTSTNRRVKWWSFLECVAVMAVSALQVMFIKRMFNKSAPGVKRMV